MTVKEPLNDSSTCCDLDIPGARWCGECDVPASPVDKVRCKPRLAAKVEAARRLCGCFQCQGGYEIGQYTISMDATSSRPTSCLASTVLAHLLAPEGMPTIMKKSKLKSGYVSWVIIPDDGYKGP